jgi:signal peptidase II
LLGTLIPLILVLDFVTKRWALGALADNVQIQLFGGLVPLTLAFNRGAAFGLSIGEDPRWVFIPITVVALVILGSLVRETSRNDILRISAIGLVVSGAIGNLYDRVRWDVGVVDFIGPIDLGFMMWPIFNVADMAITTGAVLLAISFALEKPVSAVTPAPAEGPANPVEPDPGSGALPGDSV